MMCRYIFICTYDRPHKLRVINNFLTPACLVCHVLTYTVRVHYTPIDSFVWPFLFDIFGDDLDMTLLFEEMSSSPLRAQCLQDDLRRIWGAVAPTHWKNSAVHRALPVPTSGTPTTTLVQCLNPRYSAVHRALPVPTPGTPTTTLVQCLNPRYSAVHRALPVPTPGTPTTTLVQCLNPRYSAVYRALPVPTPGMPTTTLVQCLYPRY